MECDESGLDSDPLLSTWPPKVTKSLRVALAAVLALALTALCKNREAPAPALQSWEEIPGIEEFVRRAQSLEPMEVPLPNAWNMTECVIDAVQAAAYLGQAVLVLYSAIRIDGGKCPDNTPAGCAVNVIQVLTSLSWVGAYISMAANACVAAGNGQASCANDWLTLTASLGEIATSGAAVSEDCDFSKDWEKILGLKKEEEEEPLWKHFVPAAAAPKVEKVQKFVKLNRAREEANVAYSVCAMDVTNGLSYLIREVIQIKQAIQACPQPKACAVSILSVLASFGYLLRFGAIATNDCANDFDQTASCTAYIADLYAGLVDVPANGLASTMDCT